MTTTPPPGLPSFDEAFVRQSLARRGGEPLDAAVRWIVTQHANAHLREQQLSNAHRQELTRKTRLALLGGLIVGLAIGVAIS